MTPNLLTDQQHHILKPTVQVCTQTMQEKIETTFPLHPFMDWKVLLEQLAQVSKYNKDGTTLVPKTSWSVFLMVKQCHPFLYWIWYSQSGSTHILYYINLSVRWNTLLRNQISSCQHVFYYTDGRAPFNARTTMPGMLKIKQPHTGADFWRVILNWKIVL